MKLLRPVKWEERKWYPLERFLYFTFATLPNLPRRYHFVAAIVAILPACSALVAIIICITIMPMIVSLTTRAPPEPRGCYRVSFTDINLLISLRDYKGSKAQGPNGDDHIMRVRLYYPTDDKPEVSSVSAVWELFKACYQRCARAPRGRTTWLPNPASEYSKAYGRFMKFPEWLIRYCGSCLVAIPSVLQPDQAPLLPNGPLYPVVMFSHGLGGSLSMYGTLCAEIAAKGVVVVVPEHQDGTAAVTWDGPEGGDGLGESRVEFEPYTDERNGVDVGRSWRYGQITRRRLEFDAIVEAFQRLGAAAAATSPTPPERSQEEPCGASGEALGGAGGEGGAGGTGGAGVAGGAGGAGVSVKGERLTLVASTLLPRLALRPGRDAVGLVGHSFGGATVLDVAAFADAADAAVNKSAGASAKSATFAGIASLGDDPLRFSSSRPSLGHRVSLGNCKVAYVISLDPWMYPLENVSWQWPQTAPPVLVQLTQSMCYEENVGIVQRMFKCLQAEEESSSRAGGLVVEVVNTRHQDQSDFPCAWPAAAKCFCMASDQPPTRALQRHLDVVHEFLRVASGCDGPECSPPGAPSTDHHCGSAGSAGSAGSPGSPGSPGTPGTPGFPGGAKEGDLAALRGATPSPLLGGEASANDGAATEKAAPCSPAQARTWNPAAVQNTAYYTAGGGVFEELRKRLKAEEL